MNWLRIDVILAVHKRQIAEHGGESGIRDFGLLASTLARPQNIHAYEPGADVARVTAAYAFEIARSHQFIDGNKRTSLVATRTFLVLNGFLLEATPEDKYVTFLCLAEGGISEEEFTEWLRERIIQRTEAP